jgi:hypothetical protein
MEAVASTVDVFVVVVGAVGVRAGIGGGCVAGRTGIGSRVVSVI